MKHTDTLHTILEATHAYNKRYFVETVETLKDWTLDNLKSRVNKFIGKQDDQLQCKMVHPSLFAKGTRLGERGSDILPVMLEVMNLLGTEEERDAVAAGFASVAVTESRTRVGGLREGMKVTLKYDKTKVFDAPPDLERAFRRAFPGYKGRKFRVFPQDYVSMTDTYWDGGSKSTYVMMRLIDGKQVQIPDMISGGHAPNAQQAQSALSHVNLPPGIVVVSHDMMQGKDMGLKLYVRPDNLPPSLTEAGMSGHQQCPHCQHTWFKSSQPGAGSDCPSCGQSTGPIGRNRKPEDLDSYASEPPMPDLPRGRRTYNGSWRDDSDQ